MPEARLHPVIPQELMLARLAQAEQMREFFIQMWLQNPALAAQAGARVRALLAVAPAPTLAAGDETQALSASTTRRQQTAPPG